MKRCVLKLKIKKPSNIYFQNVSVHTVYVLSLYRIARLIKINNAINIILPDKPFLSVRYAQNDTDQFDYRTRINLIIEPGSTSLLFATGAFNPRIPRANDNVT